MNKLLDEYNELNEPRKKKLRTAFIEAFEFSLDSFYKKLNKKTPLKLYEKIWLSERFDTTVNSLFPEEL